jgi:hypothetical protein
MSGDLDSVRKGVAGPARLRILSLRRMASVCQKSVAVGIGAQVAGKHQGDRVGIFDCRFTYQRGPLCHP